ncbi:MAG: hypothetical protein H0V12_09155 [Chloroflexi bacterium]|nr:hypothetical protein [Chloroflexota bacterium]
MTVGLIQRDVQDLRAKLRFSRESLARALDVSTRTVERWEGGAVTENPAVFRRLDELSEIVELGQAVYGEAFPRFLVTPRRSLAGRSPAAALLRGDVADVRDLLAQTHEGQWG